MNFSITYTNHIDGVVLVEIVLPSTDINPGSNKLDSAEPLPAKVLSALEKNTVLSEIHTAGDTITAKATGVVSSERLHITVANCCSLCVKEVPAVGHKYSSRQ